MMRFTTETKFQSNSTTSTMSWVSKDYILYDETNGVYISIDGLFSGVNTSATLTILLRVKTRYNDTTQNMVIQLHLLAIGQ